jgi:hypothetical protein
MVSFLLYAHRHQSILGATGHINDYTDTSAPADGNVAQNMVTVQSGFEPATFQSLAHELPTIFSIKVVLWSRSVLTKVAGEEEELVARVEEEEESPGLRRVTPSLVDSGGHVDTGTAVLLYPQHLCTNLDLRPAHCKLTPSKVGVQS